MASLRPVSRDEIPAVGTRAGGVSAGMVKDFLESGNDIVAVEPEDGDKSIASIRSTLGNFVKRHDVPVKVFTRGGSLYLEKVAPGSTDNGDAGAQ